MRVHAALGLAGGAGGVRHDCQIVRALRQRTGPSGECQHVAPQGYAGADDGLARCGDEVRHAQVGGTIQGVRVAGDDQMLQALRRSRSRSRSRSRQRLHLLIQVLRHEGSRRAAVLHVMAQFLRTVHWVHRHHHRVRPQDAVERHDPLRAVLHVQQHPVARLDPAIVLQESGDALGGVVEFPERDGRVVEQGERLVREPRGRDFGVVENIGLRQGQVLRQSRGPMGRLGGARVVHRVLGAKSAAL